MKKFIYSISTAVAVLAFVSCGKEDPIVENENGENSSSEFVQWSFTADMPQTKTTLDDASVTWDADDTITLYYLDGENNPKSVTATTASGGANATFTASLPAGDNPDHFWAAYPAGAGTLTYAESTEKFTITVSGGDGSFKAANFMAAYSTSAAKSFAFKHAVGIVKLTLPSGGVISHSGTDYHIKTIRIKGKETSIHSLGTVEVSQSAGAVSGFGESTGTQSSSINLAAEVLSSGVAYIPSLPGELTHGIAIRYYSDEGHIPAILTKDAAITVTRGHILPIGDFTNYITWEYYVSTDGTGNGKSAGTPMSLSDLQSMITAAGNYMFNASLITGTTIHFADGTYNLTSPLSFPNFSEMTVLSFEGNGAILDGQGASRIMEINGKQKKFSFKDFTLQNGLHASKGAAIYVKPAADATDNNLILDFKNCLIKGNTVTSGYGGALMIEAASAGQVRFDNCRFQDNAVSSGQAGAVYLIANCGVAAMFNKCTFIGNTGTSNTMTIGVNCSGSSKDDYHGRLGMNNCTVNTGNKTFSSNGSAITVKGYSVIANSTVWNSGTLGKWGHIALGANKAVQELDANAASVINSLVRNNNDTYKAFYLHSSYYQNISYCLYTGLTEASGAAKDTDYTLSNSIEISRSVDGATAKNITVDGVQAYYYTFTQDFSSEMTFPTETQVRDLINGTTNIGPLFLSWLDTLDDALTTDITGYDRNPDALHPGSWEQR